MRAMFPLLGCLLASCASSRYFAPREALNGTSPSGAPAALYQLSAEGHSTGEVRIWSDGAERSEADGHETTLLHIGFELENTGPEPLTLVHEKLVVQDFEATGVRIDTLQASRQEGDLTAEPGKTARAGFWFDPGEGVPPRSIAGFSVRWVVHRGEKVTDFEQVTPFTPIVYEYPDDDWGWGSGFFIGGHGHWGGCRR